MPIKLMVIGHARHGKDTVCGLLRDMYGLRFISSSYFCLRICVRPALAKQGIVYASDEDCYVDRVNHRDKWHDAIAAYNTPDPTRLARELYAEYDIYAGMRSILELTALKKQNVVDAVIWVDAHKRRKPEPYASNKLSPHHADYILDNNEPEAYLRGKVMAAYNWALVHSANK